MGRFTGTETSSCKWGWVVFLPMDPGLTGAWNAMAQPSSQEITVGTALGSILSALGTATRENSPCHCPGRFSGALVSPGRKQMPKSQGFWQEGLTQNSHCSDGGGPGARAPGFCAPKTHGIL